MSELAEDLAIWLTVALVALVVVAKVTGIG